LTGDNVTVDIVGSFVLVLNQEPKRTGGMITDIDFSNMSGPMYHVTGNGSYSELLSSNSPTAAPPNFTFLQLLLTINDVDNVDLSPEPMDINHSVFPTFGQSVATQPLIRPGDCFLLILKARPTAKSIAMFFRRGDVDGDGHREITDAIVLLNHLFRGGAKLVCPDAADVNDDGKLDLSDAVVLLNYLFRGDNIPLLPSRFCGIDPTEDELGCSGEQGCMS